MEKLVKNSLLRIASLETDFQRYLLDVADWDERLLVIVGARGVGKTTMILQYMKDHLPWKSEKVLYVSLDDLYFSKTNLVDFADSFVKLGGEYLFLDEVHKYKNWSQEIKNIYDIHRNLKIVITGSSALDVYRGEADLSRRAITYHLHGLSLREFIALKHKVELPVIKLEDILSSSTEIVQSILIKKIKPLKLFREYLDHGYYPFFVEGVRNYQIRLKQITNQVLENDLPSIENIDFSSVEKLRTLFSVLAEMVPYKPNILKLSQQVGVSRETLLKHMYLLAKADLLMMLKSSTSGIQKLNKPEKVYLGNPNYMGAFSEENPNTGTLRETFFFNQLGQSHKVTYSGKADFMVDNKYTFEIGGKTKTKKQLDGITNAYIASDDIEYGFLNKIPLWLFGFLY